MDQTVLMASKVAVREAHADALTAIASIYDHYVANTTATFDLEPSPASKWEALLAAADAPDMPLLVVVVDDVVRGFAYAGPYRAKPAYASTRETTIYLDPAEGGRGLGRMLYDDLLARLRSAGVHLAVAVLAMPNESSERLHAACGFTRAGVLPQVGRKFDAWIDTAIWTLPLTP